MNLGQIEGGSAIRTVTYTSGTGTFTPLVANSWCRVTLVGGGSGGANGGRGGGGGATVVARLRIPSGSVDWAVGAGSAGAAASSSVVAAAGGITYFGRLFAEGARAPASVTVSSDTGGRLVAQPDKIGSMFGDASVAGGCGGAYITSSGVSGGSVGDPSITNAFPFNTGGQGGGMNGGGGGGNSLYGNGGDGGVSGAPGQAGTGYGAGGGGSVGAFAAGNGSGGLIIIEEFGA